jgi:hypothetical protein
MKPSIAQLRAKLIARFGQGVIAPPPAKPLAGLNAIADKRDPTRPIVTIGETRHMERAEKQRFIRLAQTDNAVRLLTPLPAAGEVLHGLMDGSFHGFALAETAIEILAAPVDELVISTLSFSRANVASLMHLLDAGKVRRCLFLASVYFEKTSSADFDLLADAMKRRGQKVATARTHAKVMAIRAGETHIVIEMSANLRGCSCVEQFIVSSSRELFRFHRGWIEQLAGGGE